MGKENEIVQIGTMNPDEMQQAVRESEITLSRSGVLDVTRPQDGQNGSVDPVRVKLSKPTKWGKSNQ